MEDRDSTSTNVHYAKGKRHGHKRYYTGGKKRRSNKQRGECLELAKGERITFKDGDKILLGWVGDIVENGQYMVHSRNPALKTEGTSRTFVVGGMENPVPLCDIPADELLERGAPVLFVWDLDDIVELRPAVFLCRDRDHVRVKPPGVNTVRTVITEIFHCPYDIDIDDASTREDRHADVNVVRMIVDSYETALRESQLVFQTSQAELTKAEKGQGVVRLKYDTLLVMYRNALMAVNELRKSLFESQSKNQVKSARILTLLETLSQINGQLNQQHMKIIERNREIYLLNNKVKKIKSRK